MEQFQNLSELFKVLSHPVRLAVLDILREGEQCVCHMEAILGLRQAYISQQLMVLREAGIIEDRRDGWNIFYRVVKPEVYQLLDRAGEAMGMELPDSSSVPRSSACPCPKCNPTGRAASPMDQAVIKDDARVEE